MRMPSREFHTEIRVKRAQHGKILNRGASARAPSREEFPHPPFEHQLTFSAAATYTLSSPSVLPVDRLTRCTRVQTGQVTLS
jgi:hypothetical protein